MIKLFHFENYEVEIEPEAIMLKPFKVLWNRDRRVGHSMAKQELAYIYFMGDPRSDYQYIVDEEIRSQEVIQGLGMPESWKPDKLVKQALEFYKTFKPMSAGLLEDTRYAINNLREMLRSTDFDERDEKGKPVHTLASITSTIKQIPTLVKELDEAERALAKDIAQETRARGSQVKSILEDEN